MHISKIQLLNFKRFSDLTIDLSAFQPPPKLVLLIGANGSGKSSLFDAFERLSQVARGEHGFFDDYYKKDRKTPRMFVDFDNYERIKHTFPSFPTEKLSYDVSFYGRSAMRQTPRLTRKALTATVDVGNDSDRPRYLIDIDERFENDVVLLINKILGEVFNEKGEFDAKILRERYIVPINEALKRIFGEDVATTLALMNLSLPTNGKPAQITFKKGNSTFEYELLSSGEKEIFSILLNLLMRRDSFQDTIYFIDELDVHLNTSLQYSLLKEITENWIPENCQFWTASHSLGFIQYAREFERAVILDFDQFDFDLPQTIVPQPKETLEVFEVAVPKEVIFQIFDGKQIILCENKDDDYYNLLNLGDKVFVGVQDKDTVFRNIKANIHYFGIIDRDYLADNEINTLQARYPNLFILDLYTFENYLYHPENIREAAADFDVEAYKQNLIEHKKAQYDTILLNLKPTRSGYKILRDENLSSNLSSEADLIVQSLRSDEFEDFYKFLNMKNVNHSFIDKTKITKKQLAKTSWFKNKITEILSRPRQSA